MPSSGIGAFQVIFSQIVFGGTYLLLVLMGVRAMMGGGTLCLQLLGVFSVLVGAVLAQKVQWVLRPMFLRGLRCNALIDKI